MVKAVLCAGLMPNLLAMPPGSRVSAAADKMVRAVPGQAPSGGDKGGAKKNTDVALDGQRGKMHMHPSSVLGNVKLRSNYLLYLEAQVTSKVYARDLTSVSPLVCMLFAGKISLFERQQVVILDNWLGFKVEPVLCSVVMRVRALLESAFNEKIMEPAREADGDDGDANAKALTSVLSMVETLVLGE